MIFSALDRHVIGSTHMQAALYLDVSPINSNTYRSTDGHAALASEAESHRDTLSDKHCYKRSMNQRGLNS